MYGILAIPQQVNNNMNIFQNSVLQSLVSISVVTWWVKYYHIYIKNLDCILKGITFILKFTSCYLNVSKVSTDISDKTRQHTHNILPHLNSYFKDIAWWKVWAMGAKRLFNLPLLIFTIINANLQKFNHSAYQISQFHFCRVSEENGVTGVR